MTPYVLKHRFVMKPLQNPPFCSSTNIVAYTPWWSTESFATIRIFKILFSNQLLPIPPVGLPPGRPGEACDPPAAPPLAALPEPPPGRYWL
jgi:hypothetical protein